MELVAGYWISSSLALVRAIGEGGMASVWVAEDRAGRRVAVKVLSEELASHQEAVARFTREAKALERIHSAFVPRVYDHGALSDGTPYLVMELLEGVDLDAYLRAHGPLSLRATVRLVAQVAAALDEAHGLGIVHRDVKAENIFVTQGGEDLSVKLFDFGIAKIPLAERGVRRTLSTTMMGTPCYMSLEQLMSTRDVDGRADLWSLGVVAYLALTGKLPFEGETFGAICIAINQGVFDLPSQLRPEIPEEVDGWIQKALDRDINARFPTAKELSRAFEVASGERHALVLVQEEVAAEVRPSLVGTARTTITTLRGATEPRRRIAVMLAAACAGALAYGASAPRLLHRGPRPAVSSGLQAASAVRVVPVVAVVPVVPVAAPQLVDVAPDPPKAEVQPVVHDEPAPTLAPWKPWKPWRSAARAISSSSISPVDHLPDAVDGGAAAVGAESAAIPDTGATVVVDPVAIPKTRPDEADGGNTVASDVFRTF